jgi:hypothetical protein
VRACSRNEAAASRAARGRPNGGSQGPVDPIRDIRRIFGRIQEEFKWTDDVVDALLWARVEEILEHWREEPPIGAVVRAWLRVEPGQTETSKALQEMSVEEYEKLKANMAANAQMYGRRR